MRRRKRDEDLVVIRAVRIIPEHRIFPYAYTFKTSDDVTDIFGDLLDSGMEVWASYYLFVPSNESVDEDEDENDEEVVEAGKNVIPTM